MEMKISFKNMDPSDALKVFTEEKSSRLSRYFNGKINVHWTFSLQALEKTAHCHLVGNHMDYFGEAADEDIHTAIDQALDKIEKQLRKHKEIVKNHHHPENRD